MHSEEKPGAKRRPSGDISHRRAHVGLILASASPRRRELIKCLKRPFRVVTPRVDETVPEGVSPLRAAMLLAERKAESVARRVRSGLVLGADTLVAVGRKIIGKPRDRAHAIEILFALSRRPHVVITGVCLLDARSGRRLVGASRTRVFMRRMSAAEIREYVDSGEALGKAGAYAIQERGDRFVRRIEGSYTNVVGLPLELVRRMLKRFEEG